jgi:tRNA (guanosine-2'-O-)-methyltransferase
VDFSELDRLIDELGPPAMVELLSPYVTDARRERIERVLAGRLESIRVAVEHPEDPHNAAAIVRSAEALGAMHVHVVDAPSGALNAPATTQGAFCWVHTHHHRSFAELLAVARSQGVALAGAMMEGACTLEELPADRPLLLLFGNEGEGLSRDARDACDFRFRIPMVGMSESMNLSVCGALALYSVTRARRAQLGRPGDLDGERLDYERARYYARSVERRLLDGLMAQRLASAPSRPNES